MFNPISPEFQRIIYKEREKELELAIQMKLAREARGETNPAKQASPWYAQAARWLEASVPFLAFKRQAAPQPAPINEPCPGCPC